jgi:hypothetical protein
MAQDRRKSEVPELAGKQSVSSQVQRSASSVAAAPGKRTLVETVCGDTPVQRQAGEGAQTPSDGIHAAAARGTATPAGPLPHAGLIQRAFGRHDISSVKAHVGGDAAASAGDMGATAYATGDHVVLGGSADLFTEAHEAAHVVQQRAGVHLKGGVGEDGDSHERHADSVATAVVQGKSAEGLLDQVAPASASGRSAGVQRQPAPQPQAGAAQATTALQQALDDGRWNESIRPRMYKQLSAPAVQRAKDRRKPAGAPPDLTGVGSITSLDAFAAAVKAAQAAWAPPTTPDQRAHKLFDAANAELVKAKVPKLKDVSIVDMLPRGQFDPKAWAIHIQKAMIDNNALSNDAAADLCNTTLHEARHCEQHWLAARWDASQGKLAAEIVTKHGIHGDIAIKAVHEQIDRKKAKKPWDSPAQETLAHEQFDGFVTNGAANDQPAADTQAAIQKLQADHVTGQAKLAALKANPTPVAIADAKTAAATLRKDIKDVEDAYTRYRATPFDADAHEVGDSAELAFRNLP